MREYVFIIADAELEPIPDRILRERCVLNSARARNKSPDRMLLDASHHHPAFGKLPDGDRRGRPDIVHFSLLLLLDSDLSSQGRLKVFVHTRNDDVIAVKPETRLPANFIRFVGLIEQLFEQQVVPSRENALLELRQKVPLDMLVDALKVDEVIVLDPEGERVLLDGAISSSEAQRLAVIIGGFPKGTFKSDLRKLKPRRISLGARSMKAWTVASKALRSIEAIESQSTSAETTDAVRGEPERKPRKKTAKAKGASGARRARKET
ncbi:MAG: 16S rRNA methyltransferase [Methanobacteriota archaeon]|nr:MAG: 16S rRNA methyltransferase [Euryarchaeota archaeon]